MKLNKLSHQILVVFVAVVVLVLGISGWAVARLAERIITDNVIQGHQVLAHRIAEEIDQQMEDIRPIISQLADSPRIKSLEPTQTAAELRAYRARFPTLNRIYVTDRSGQQIARTDEGLLENAATVLGLQIALEGHELVSDVYLSPDGQGPMLTIYAPITDGGQIVGVLVADINLARVQTILASLTLTHDETAAIVASNGRVIAHSRMAELTKPLELDDPALIQTLVRGPAGIHKDYIDELGRTVVGVHVPVSGLGWTILIQTPTKELLNEVISLHLTMGLGLLAGAALAVIAGWLMAHRLTIPVGQLVQATERVAAGDLSASVRVNTSNELGQLAQSFNQMVVTLRESGHQVEQLYAEVKELNIGLEQQVVDRTRELTTLLQVSHTVASTLELAPLLDLILDKLKSVVGYDGASILKLDAEGLTVLTYQGPIAQEKALQLHLTLENAGANRHVIELREPLIIPDVRGDTPQAHAFQETAGDQLKTTFDYIRSWMGVPLIVQDQVIGMLTLDHSQPGYYTPHQAELALAFANQTAVAIENAQHFKAEQRRAEQFRVISEVGRHVTSILAVDEVLQTITRLTREALGYYLVGIGLIAVTGGALVLGAALEAVLVPSLLLKLALIQHNDLINRANGVEAMGNNQGSAALQYLFE